MIDSVALRWVVTILFALAAAQCVYLLVARRMPWTSRVGHVLHLVMSVAMLVMAWPFSMSWPTLGPMVFFIVAAVWFLATLLRPGAADAADDCGCVPPTATVFGRVAAVYHAAMMAAMAWMYAVMNGDVLPGAGSVSSGALAAGPVGSSPLILAHDHGDMGDMGGMDMPGMGGGHMSHSSGPAYVAPVNWILAVGFALAAAYWLYLYFDRRRQPGASDDVLSFAGDLCQVFMALGMSLMFFVMVV